MPWCLKVASRSYWLFFMFTLYPLRVVKSSVLLEKVHENLENAQEGTAGYGSGSYEDGDGPVSIFIFHVYIIPDEG